MAAIEGIHVKAFAAIGHDDNEFADLPAAHQVFPGLPPAVLAPAFFIFEKPVQKIEHRISIAARIVSRRQRHAITHCPAQDGAGDGIAGDAGAALRKYRWSEQDNRPKRQAGRNELCDLRRDVRR